MRRSGFEESHLLFSLNTLLHGRLWQRSVLCAHHLCLEGRCTLVKRRARPSSRLQRNKSSGRHCCRQRRGRGALQLSGFDWGFVVCFVAGLQRRASSCAPAGLIIHEHSTETGTCRKMIKPNTRRLRCSDVVAVVLTDRWESRIQSLLK